RRCRNGATVGHDVAAVVDARPFRDRHTGLYRGERAVRHRLQPRSDDCLSRDAGLLRRRDHAPSVAGRSQQVPWAAPLHREGPRWDWLADETIRAAVAVSAIASAFFFWRVLTYHQPIVDVRTFLNRNFALGAFFTFTIGIGMYGTTYLVPLFLAQVRGYSALQ